MKFQTPYSLCASAPLRDINHPAFMQRRDACGELLYETLRERYRTLSILLIKR